MKCATCCSVCKKKCAELHECDCAEYSDLCQECWQKVPTRHREEVCIVNWLDYDRDMVESN